MAQMQHSSPQPPSPGQVAPRRDRIFLSAFAALWIFLYVVLNAAGHWLTQHGLLPSGAFDSCLAHLYRFFGAPVQCDSWNPMLQALHAWQAHPAQSIYGSVFFTQHVKFQYPLSSLLILAPLTPLHLADAEIISAANWISRVAFLLTALLCAAIAQTSATLANPLSSRRLALPQLFAVVVGSICFYPLLSGLSLGQIQTVLTLLYCATFYCWLRGAERAAGVLIAVIALVKPQFVFLLIWSAVRRRWGAFYAGLATLLAGTSASIAVFGWRNNLEYAGVVRAIAHTGEAFLPNQSMNGLLNRLLYNGDPFTFSFNSFAPYHPAVYAGTAISSVLLLAFALAWPWGAHRSGIADFACAAACATLASPVAWTHHYGVFLPILVWLWFGYFRTRPGVSNAAWLVTAYALIGGSLSPLVLAAGVPVLNIVLSYTYLGGLIVVALLALSASARQTGTPAVFRRRKRSPLTSAPTHA
jgi:hypothetical protein